MEHFEEVVSRAGGADESAPQGYEDAQGRWRHPHKLMIVEVHAGWCRVCKGLQPKLLKLIRKHPEVLCCKINKTENEVYFGPHASSPPRVSQKRFRACCCRMSGWVQASNAALGFHDSLRQRIINPPWYHHSARTVSCRDDQPYYYCLFDAGYFTLIVYINSITHVCSRELTVFIRCLKSRVSDAAIALPP